MANKRICAVVKADAYGHGAVDHRPCEPRAHRLQLAPRSPSSKRDSSCARRASACPSSFLGGAFGEEGFDAIVDNDLTPVIWSSEHLGALARAAGDRDIAYHFKVDTGMSRLGAQPSELQAFLSAAQAHPNLILDGFVSHFASADVVGDAKNETQVAGCCIRFAGTVRDSGHDPHWIHIMPTRRAPAHRRSRRRSHAHPDPQRRPLRPRHPRQTPKAMSR